MSKASLYGVEKTTAFVFQGVTPLWGAATAGHADVVTLLIEARADVNAASNVVSVLISKSFTAHVALTSTNTFVGLHAAHQLHKASRRRLAAALISRHQRQRR